LYRVAFAVGYFSYRASVPGSFNLNSLFPFTRHFFYPHRSSDTWVAFNLQVAEAHEIASFKEFPRKNLEYHFFMTTEGKSGRLLDFLSRNNPLWVVLERRFQVLYLCKVKSNRAV
jgi:hypothetical protein